MYVCICNALTDRDVKGALGAGVRTASEVHRRCGCVPQCGRCKPFIKSLMAENQGEEAVPAAALPL
jgi:bacterioferritin-associated ferredoxin